MNKIFIGGSRKVSRINDKIRLYLDQIIEQGCYILIGDANGADKAIQQHLQKRGYRGVEVFCMEGICRNNIGKWNIREIQAKNKKRDLEFYSIKDKQMAKEASIGFMVWDGKSAGTLINIGRLIQQKKKVDIYLAPTKDIFTIKDLKTFEELISRCEDDIRDKINSYIKTNIQQLGEMKQRSLFEITSP